MRIRVSSNIGQIEKKLLAYEMRFHFKLQKFIRLLADNGLRIGEGYLEGNQYAPYIYFYTEKVEIGLGYVSLDFCAANIHLIRREWYPNRSAEVSPILMAEFGSGVFAVDEGVEGVGRGTFPGQVHAFEPVWFWRERKHPTIQHSSSGEEPAQFMLKTAQDLWGVVMKCVKESFN